jgi:Sulfotransferase family
MRDPVIILAAPRSFTSILCGVLGQHPEMYGLPEVNLFVAETIRERQGVIARPRFSEHGLLRVVAQLFAGEQTLKTIALSRTWIKKRWNLSCLSVFQELVEKVNPRILVEKSPRTVTKSEYMQRVRRAFPDARFIHLVRHPRSQGESVWKMGGRFAADGLGALDYGFDPPLADYQKAWYSLNMNIVTFLDGVPKEQWRRIRGENLLGDLDAHLREIAQWLGLRTDKAAIDMMKHPERSPYACLGPVTARFGNDPKFLKAPELRLSRGSKQLSLEGPLSWREDGSGFSPEVKTLAREFGYT